MDETGSLSIYVHEVPVFSVSSQYSGVSQLLSKEAIIFSPHFLHKLHEYFELFHLLLFLLYLAGPESRSTHRWMWTLCVPLLFHQLLNQHMLLQGSALQRSFPDPGLHSDRPG